MKQHLEARLEDAIVDHLITKGGSVFVTYCQGPNKGGSHKARALDPFLVLKYIICAKNWRPRAR